MRFFSYVVARDYGFAPNPFEGICTLAACKPRIRRAAVVGDWIFGSGSATHGMTNRLIFAMKVTKKITFNEYWSSNEYQTKKPVMNGSLKKMYGDNIYFCENDVWHQVNSHHSLEDGNPNIKNVNNDTGTNAVLISDFFYYFGCEAFEIPTDLLPYIIVRGRRNHRGVAERKGRELISILENEYEPCYLYGDPVLFQTFKRYNPPGKKDEK